MKVYQHALLILGSFLLVFVWENTEFSQYTIPLIGFLIFIFLLVSIRNKMNFNLGGPVNFFILNTVLLLFIFSTGGLSSSLFFILYFLLFAASFIIDERTVFIYPVGVIIVFWSQIFGEDMTSNLIKLASLILLTPLSYFFGKTFKRSEKQEDEVLKTKERSVAAGEEISKDTKEVLQTAESKLNPEEKEKLKEVADEADDLRTETKT